MYYTHTVRNKVGRTSQAGLHRQTESDTVQLRHIGTKAQAETDTQPHYKRERER